ncbi:MAG: CBS domain-containing protein [Chloroflexi bacterium]|nr:CBS domain-containing protein [Chloroflexota bacterium]
MDAILTHENADLDALAALVGAKKIYPQARAVLPHRLNRNVRDFVALYADALALTRADELTRDALRDILIVDSQASPSARGIDKKTRLHFLDHHPLARVLRAGDTFSGGDVGATTTLLVEEIREKNLALASLEATALLLGIYEDTGSLLYGTTTPRDARAAAYLLEQDARLDIVRDFLHHPLTDEQRALYQDLLEHTETLDLDGHSIAIAAARAPKYAEEVASLAHQLREVYDPAALFVLVQMQDHIQLVARSDRDAIDVAEIARVFGGRGHPRAAAALIQDATLKQTKTKLLKLLRATIKPSVTVQQIMSTGAQTLEPQASVTHAAEMMRRYGHEGFPVVQRNKLVGVLTRREIDRALQHHLGNAPVKNFMRQPISVSPDDSLEKLRAVMIETDLGQVPVVDKKKIVGIVTRTDLFKQSAAVRAPQAKNLTASLEKNLSPSLLKLLRAASETARELGFSLYIVGGFVRDLLLNQPNLDLDLVVEGDAIALAQNLQKKLGGRVHAHARFGTANWVELEKLTSQLRGAAHLINHLDFATARREFYAHPSALPEVERSSIKQDLLRRDFTINTLALALDPDRFGQLLDLFGGEADLQRGLIRVLHNLSFIEDPTRILRAVRFESRLNFKIEERTAQLIGDALEMLPRVSGERVRAELALIFEERDPAKAMLRLNELGVLKAIHPALAFSDWHAARFRAINQPKPAFYWGVWMFELRPAQIQEVAHHLMLSNEIRDTILQAIGLLSHRDALSAQKVTPSVLVRILDPISEDAREIFSIALDEPHVRVNLARYHDEWRLIAAELNCDDLKQMGIPPSPRYREILTRLRDARLDGRVSSRAEEEDYVQQISAEWNRSIAR